MIHERRYRHEDDDPEKAVDEEGIQPRSIAARGWK